MNGPGTQPNMFPKGDAMGEVTEVEKKASAITDEVIEKQRRFVAERLARPKAKQQVLRPLPDFNIKEVKAGSLSDEKEYARDSKGNIVLKEYADE